MKRIINGKTYNTATATELASWSNGVSVTDFDYTSETLYRTRGGAFFLAGEGGARSQYGERHGKDYTGGEAIRPLTRAAAAEWLEEHGTAEEYEGAFGTPPEAGDGEESAGEAVLYLRVPASLAARVKAAAPAKGMSVNTWLMRAAERALTTE